MSADGPAIASGARSRVIYLSQLFDPEPTFKGLEFVKELQRHGFEVEVVTGFPNYPGGKVFEGYRVRPIARDRMNGTDVTRLAMYPSHDRSAMRRMLTYLSFMLTSFLYLVFVARRSALVYVYYPSLTAGLSAVAAKLFRRTPVVIDIQDMWPDSLGSSGIMRSRLMLGLVHRACNLLYRACDHIVVLSPGFKALLMERGVPSDKISVIYNWAEETPRPTDQALAEGFDPSDDFRVLFAGNMGTAQKLDVVIDAAARLQLDQVGCSFYLMGEGVERDRLAARAKDMGLANVRFLPRVPLSEVQRFLVGADALLVHLTDDPLFRITIPSKTQAYLYAGRPILMGVGGDAADLVTKANAGLVFASGDAPELAESVRSLIAAGPRKRAEMGRSGHDFYMSYLRSELGIAAIVDVMDRFRRRNGNDVVVSGELP